MAAPGSSCSAPASCRQLETHAARKVRENHKTASGFALGTNIKAATAPFSADKRFSEYRVYWTSTDDMKQLRDDAGGTNGNLHGLATDPTVPRYRPRLIMSEQTDQGVDIGSRRAMWEMNRRNGRSQSISLTCDNWRDSAGALRKPNNLATVDAPILKLSGKSVSFRKSPTAATTRAPTPTLS